MSVEPFFCKELDPGGTAGLHLHWGARGPWVGKRVKKPSHPVQTGLEPPLAASDICPGGFPEGPGQAGASGVSHVSRLEQGACGTSLSLQVHKLRTTSTHWLLPPVST